MIKRMGEIGRLLTEARESKASGGKGEARSEPRPLSGKKQREVGKTELPENKPVRLNAERLDVSSSAPEKEKKASPKERKEARLGRKPGAAEVWMNEKFQSALDCLVKRHDNSLNNISFLLNPYNPEVVVKEIMDNASEYALQKQERQINLEDISRGLVQAVKRGEVGELKELDPSEMGKGSGKAYKEALGLLGSEAAEKKLNKMLEKPELLSERNLEGVKRRIGLRREQLLVAQALKDLVGPESDFGRAYKKWETSDSGHKISVTTNTLEALKKEKNQWLEKREKAANGLLKAQSEAEKVAYKHGLARADKAVGISKRRVDRMTDILQKLQQEKKEKKE